MKRVGATGGFTIVETMIFLVVSAALLGTFLTLIEGSTRKNEFITAFTDVTSQINKVIDNVSTGTYNNTAGFTCGSNGSSGPTFNTTAGTDNQGANAGGSLGVGCIFLGRAILFAPAGSNLEGYNIYDIAGQRQISSGGVTQEVTSLAQAEPKVIAKSATDSAAGAAMPSTAQGLKLENGLTLHGIRYRSGGSMHDTGAFAVMNDFASVSGGGGLVPGSKRAQLYALDINGANTSKVPVPPTTIQQGLDADVEYMIDLMNYNSTIHATGTKWVPVNEVDLCFLSGGTNQYYLMTIGGDNDTHQVATQGTIWGVSTPLTGNFSGGCS